MIRSSQFAVPAAAALAAVFFFGSGCTHERADEIPMTAVEVTEGTETVSATAPRDGTFYVWDATANRMLYVGKVDKGQMVKVDAKKDRMLLDGQLITKRDDLVNDHRYKIFFDKADLDKAERERVERIERTTVTSDPNAPRTTVTVPESRQTTIEKETVVKERSAD